MKRWPKVGKRHFSRVDESDLMLGEVTNRAGVKRKITALRMMKSQQRLRRVLFEAVPPRMNRQGVVAWHDVSVKSFLRWLNRRPVAFRRVINRDRKREAKERMRLVLTQEEFAALQVVVGAAERAIGADEYTRLARSALAGVKR